MKTTKILMLAAMLATTVSASAQFSNAGKSTGTSDLLQPAANKKYVRLGAAMNSISIRQDNLRDLDSKLGYVAAFGIQKPLGNQGMHINGEAGFASRGGSYEERDSRDNYTLTTHQLFVAPHVGWELSVANGITIDPHLGLYIAYDLFGNATEEIKGNDHGRETEIHKADLKDLKDEGWSAFDAGLNIGCGVWINNKWNIDLRYKTSFIDCVDKNKAKYKDDYSYGTAKSWVLSAAYAF